MNDKHELTAVNQLRLAVSERAPQLLPRADLTGIGIGHKSIGGISTREPCIKFLVRRKLPLALLAPADVLPSYVQAGRKTFLTDVEEALRPMAPMVNAHSVGHPLAAAPSFDPVLRGGISAANELSYYGTLGCCYRSGGRTNGPLDLFISCNHVLASYNLAPFGTDIRAPALYQGNGMLPRHIGELAMFIPLRFGLVNRFDLAAGRISNGNIGSSDIVEIGPVAAAVAPDDIMPGQLVFKTGSGSGKTSGRIISVHTVVKVDYWPLGTLGSNTVFVDQIVTSPMGALGDSGAVLLDEQSRQLGLLFAGTQAHTYFNYIAAGLAALDL